MATLDELEADLTNKQAVLAEQEEMLGYARTNLDSSITEVNKYTDLVRQADAAGDRENRSIYQLSLDAAIAERNQASEAYLTAQADADAARADVDIATSNFSAANDPTTTVKDTNGATNDPLSEADTAEKYADPQNADANTDTSIDDAETARFKRQSYDPTNETTAETARLARSGVPPGAEPRNPVAAKPEFVNDNKESRVRLKIPSGYLTQSLSYILNANDSVINTTKMRTFTEANGIVFPFTPTISQDYKANYSQQSPIHTNYSLYFYKNSAPGPITLGAKFAVQEEADAGYVLTVIHLLRGLVKMKYGVDADAGAPPPVCRLFAYGPFMFDNTPVVVESFRIDFPDTYDYYTSNYWFPGTAVPTLMTLNINLLPVYSRTEMANFSMSEWLNGNLRNKGYL